MNRPEQSATAQRLSTESLTKLRALFAEQAEKGATIFHQAHAEELLAMADELLSLRSETSLADDLKGPRYPDECSAGQNLGPSSARSAAARTLDRDWWRKQGIEACMDRMEEINARAEDAEWKAAHRLEMFNQREQLIRDLQTAAMRSSAPSSASLKLDPQLERLAQRAAESRLNPNEHADAAARLGSALLKVTQSASGLPADSDVRDCRCADPENCREPVPGYRCKAGK